MKNETTSTGKLYGYARVSTAAQDHDRQVVDLQAAGVRSDDIYVDHGVSGARDKRPALDKVLGHLREGDTLVFTTLDRLGRSADHVIRLSRELSERGVNLKVLNLGGESIDTRTPVGKLLFTVMSGIAEMELDIKRERAQDSIAKRRAKGGDLGGRPRVVSDETLRVMREQVESGKSVAEVCRRNGISRAAYYKRLASLSN